MFGRTEDSKRVKTISWSHRVGRHTVADIRCICRDLCVVVCIHCWRKAETERRMSPDVSSSFVASFAIYLAKAEISHKVQCTGLAFRAFSTLCASVMVSFIKLATPDGFRILALRLCTLAHDACPYKHYSTNPAAIFCIATGMRHPHINPHRKFDAARK